MCVPVSGYSDFAERWWLYRVVLCWPLYLWKVSVMYKVYFALQILLGIMWQNSYLLPMVTLPVFHCEKRFAHCQLKGVFIQCSMRQCGLRVCSYAFIGEQIIFIQCILCMIRVNLPQEFCGCILYNLKCVSQHFTIC